MHESHTLIIKKDEEEEQKAGLVKNTEEFWMMRKQNISSVEVIEFLEIPIGSPKCASCSKYDTIFSPQWL